MKKFFTGALLAGLPVIAMAQTSAFSILGVIRNLLNILIPLLITAALLYFIYGVVRYVIASDSDDKEKARDIVIRGVVGLFVIVSVWGLVGIIQTTFGIGSGGALDSSNIPGVIN